MDPFIRNLSCVTICKGTLFIDILKLQFCTLSLVDLWTQLTCNLKLHVPFPQRIYRVLEIT